MSYKHPIIIEIYSDLRLEAGSLPFARFFEVVPSLNALGFGEVELGDVVQIGFSEIQTAPKIHAEKQPRVRCWSSDRTKLVQLAADTITMNLVSPDGTYPGWRRFVDDVVVPALSALEILGTKSGPRPSSIALNTLDAFSFDGGVIGEYLNCGGPQLPVALADAKEAFDYDVGRGRIEVDGHNRQLHINGRPDGDRYFVNIRSVFQEQLDATKYGIVPTLERLHELSNDSFESLITQRTRDEVMGGVIRVDSTV